MNEYLKQYIELQKQFRETEGDPDSVRALYTFKEKLELSEDKQAKEVLVDVYDLLDFKKDAYELLCQIGNRSDKKTLKRLGILKDYAENWGNHYALPRPKTPEEKQKEKERQAQLGLPAFRYHPNPLETGAFEESADGVVCDCCGKTTHIFYTAPLGGTTMSQIASFYLIKNNQRQELSDGDCSGAVYMAIWDWCESELDLDVRFPAPQTEDTLDCALLEGELASQLLAALREQDLSELAAEIAPDWDLPTEAVQSGLNTLRSHLELVQGDAALLYEMT